MEKLTQKQLISKLQQLKEIKPRQEWASLLKSQILSEEKVVVQKNPATFAGVFSSIFQTRTAYAFAVLLILIMGVVGFMKFETPAQVKTVAVQSQASVIASLDSKIKVLAKTPSASNIKDINANASALAANLKSNPTNNPATLNQIANSLKTLAEVPGTSLAANPGVQDLYQTVVNSQISDLQKETLTPDQQTTLDNVIKLRDTGKYSDALEQILMINTTTPSTQP